MQNTPANSGSGSSPGILSSFTSLFGSKKSANAPANAAPVVPAVGGRRRKHKKTRKQHKGKKHSKKSRRH